MDLYEMTEKLEQFAMEEMSKDKSCINTKELGEVVDMVKDLLEAKKYKAEAKYYTSITDAMEDAEYGQDYDYRGRMGYSGGRRMSMRGYEEGEYRMLPEERYGYPQGGGGSRGGSQGGGQGNRGGSGGSQSRGGQGGSSRYGYSHDEYMQSKKSSNDPEKRKELLNEYMNDLQNMAKDMIEDMTPDEKQMWKVKLNKIMNM